MITNTIRNEPRIACQKVGAIIGFCRWSVGTVLFFLLTGGKLQAQITGPTNVFGYVPRTVFSYTWNPTSGSVHLRPSEGAVQIGSTSQLPVHQGIPDPMFPNLMLQSGYLPEGHAVPRNGGHQFVANEHVQICPQTSGKDRLMGGILVQGPDGQWYTGVSSRGLNNLNGVHHPNPAIDAFAIPPDMHAKLALDLEGAIGKSVNTPPANDLFWNPTRDARFDPESYRIGIEGGSGSVKPVREQAWWKQGAYDSPPSSAQGLFKNAKGIGAGVVVGFGADQGARAAVREAGGSKEGEVVAGFVARNAATTAQIAGISKDAWKLRNLTKVNLVGLGAETVVNAVSDVGGAVVGSPECLGGRGWGNRTPLIDNAEHLKDTTPDGSILGYGSAGIEAMNRPVPSIIELSRRNPATNVAGAFNDVFRRSSQLRNETVVGDALSLLGW